MEVGETLTITSAVSTTAYVARRAKTNEEVTIRVAPSRGGAPPSSINPSTKLRDSTKLISSSFFIPTLPDRRCTLPAQQQAEKEWKGWGMMATSSTMCSWVIAWICATAISTPRICIMKDAEALATPTPTKFEEITHITEVEEGKETDKGKKEGQKEKEGDRPVKFEVKTTESTCNIATNGSLTVGMRILMKQLPSSTPRQRTNTPYLSEVLFLSFIYLLKK